MSDKTLAKGTVNPSNYSTIIAYIDELLVGEAVSISCSSSVPDEYGTMTNIVIVSKIPEAGPEFNPDIGAEMKLTFFCGIQFDYDCKLVFKRIHGDIDNAPVQTLTFRVK